MIIDWRPSTLQLFGKDCIESVLTIDGKERTSDPANRDYMLVGHYGQIWDNGTNARVYIFNKRIKSKHNKNNSFRVISYSEVNTWCKKLRIIKNRQVQCSIANNLPDGEQ